MAKNSFWTMVILITGIFYLSGGKTFGERLRYAPNSVIILAEKGAIKYPDNGIRRTVSFEEVVVSNYVLEDFLKDLKAESFKKIFPNAIPDDTLRILDDGSRAKLKDLSRYYVVEFDSAINVETVAESLRGFQDIKYAEPNWLYYPMVDPNDPYYGNQWHLHGSYGIHAPSAWDISTGFTTTKIAVVDGGVDYNHEDLASKRYGGWDYGDDDSDPMDDMEEGPEDDQFGNHGTPVAGIIGAVTNNDTGVAGVDWNCRIMPIKIAGTHQFLLWEWDAQTTGDAAAGISHAANDGADVINMSFGSYLGWWSEIIVDNAVYSACYNAHQLGAVLVAAAGNEETSDPLRPAAFPFVIAVGATDNQGNKADFSNYGDYIDLVAPGVGIYSTRRYDDYWYGSGTSFSAPIVSGLSGLLLAKNTDLTNEDVRQVLEITARDRGDPGWDPQFGYGIANADSALRLLDSHMLLHWTAAGGSSEMTWGSHKHTFFNNAGLPSGQYKAVEQWKVTQQIDYPGLGLETAPFVWARKRGTEGWSGANPNFELSWASVVPGSVTPTGCTIITFLYFLKYNLANQIINEWWPCAPEDVIVNYTILGDVGVQTPLAEVNLIQGSDNHHFHITWSDDNEFHDGYELQCAICPEEELCVPDYFTVATLPSTCQSYNYTPDVGSARYWFRVKAIWGDMESDWSEASCLNVPNPPTNPNVRLHYNCGWPQQPKMATEEEDNHSHTSASAIASEGFPENASEHSFELAPEPGPEPPCFPTNRTYVTWDPPENQIEPVDYYMVRLLLYLGGSPNVFPVGPYDAQACTLCLWPNKEYRLSVVAHKYGLHSDETFGTQVFTTGEAIICSDYCHKGSPPQTPESQETEITNNMVSGYRCLIQNHPNPFNPETDISYNLPEDCMVSLVVYNMLGQRVRVLVNEPQNAGLKTVHWDGKDDYGNELASGVYFCRLQAGNHDECKKMVLMR
jgi:subtilisin family serine protease